MYIPMECMRMHSPHLPTVYGGTGVITPTDGVAIPLMDLAGTAGTAQTGASVGAAGTAVDGDITIIITMVADGILVADTGEAAEIGLAIACIPIDVLMGHHLLVEMEFHQAAQCVVTLVVL